MKLMTINLNLDGNGTVFFMNVTVKVQLGGKTLQNGEERYKETKVGQKQISTNPQQSKKTSNNNGS